MVVLPDKGTLPVAAGDDQNLVLLSVNHDFLPSADDQYHDIAALSDDNFSPAVAADDQYMVVLPTGECGEISVHNCVLYYH
jgi:hypothetical protein